MTLAKAVNALRLAAIRFGRMPHAEKLKLKEESKVAEREVESCMEGDRKTLVRQIHDAYMKNFTMNKAKARLILTGKTSEPVTFKNPIQPILSFILRNAKLVYFLFLNSLLLSTTWTRFS